MADFYGTVSPLAETLFPIIQNQSKVSPNEVLFFKFTHPGASCLCTQFSHYLLHSILYRTTEAALETLHYFCQSQKCRRVPWTVYWSIWNSCWHLYTLVRRSNVYCFIVLSFILLCFNSLHALCARKFRVKWNHWIIIKKRKSLILLVQCLSE